MSLLQLDFPPAFGQDRPGPLSPTAYSGGYNVNSAAYSPFGQPWFSAPYNYANQATPQPDPLPARFHDFVSGARAVARNEGANLEVRYDSREDTVILDAGTSPVSFAASRVIDALAHESRVSFRLLGPLQ